MLGIVVALALAQSGGPRVAAGAGPTVACGAMFLAAAVVSSVGGESAGLALAKLVPVGAEMILALGVLPFVVTGDDWRWYLARLRWVLGALCCAALILGVALPGAVNADGRLAALSNPNSTGFLAMLGFCLWLGAGALSREAGRERGLAIGLLLVSAATIWWTGSRASLGGALVGFVLWTIARREWRLSFAGAAALIFVYVAVPETFEAGAGLAEARLLRGASLTASREHIWEASLESWEQSPWFGYGFGVSAVAQVWEDAQLGQSVGALRDGSGYLGVLESVGVVGTALLMATLLLVTVHAFREARAPAAAARDLALTGLVTMGALLTNAAAEPWLLGPGSYQSFTLWTFVGMVLGLRTARRAHPASGAVSPGNRWIR